MGSIKYDLRLERRNVTLLLTEPRVPKHLGEIQWFLANGTICVAKRFALCLTAEPSRCFLERKGSKFSYLGSFRVHRFRRKPLKWHLSSINHKSSMQVIAIPTISSLLDYVKFLQATLNARKYENHAGVSPLIRNSGPTDSDEIWYKKRVVFPEEVKNGRRSEKKL